MRREGRVPARERRNTLPMTGDEERQRPEEAFRAVKWIFFDVGSTLADESEAHRGRFDSIRATLEERAGRKVDFCEFEEKMYEGGRSSEKHGPFGYALSCFGCGGMHVSYSSDREEVYPEATEALHVLSEKYSLGIIANQLPGLPERLEKMGLSRFFVKSAVFGSGDCGMEKPGTGIFACALAAAGCEPREAVMVGDLPKNDIAPAASAGMRTVRIRRGYFKDRPAAAESEIADADISDLDGLVKLLIKE